MRSLAIVIALSSTAHADDFAGADALGSLGLGLAIDHEPTTAPAANYDYSLRVGHVVRASDRIRPGGFVELHSLDLELFDAAIGPQLQYRIGEQLALQLRAGVGLGSDGTHVLAGVQLGTYYLGGSITARRAFDTHDVVVSMNIEVVALLPAALAIALGSQ